MDKLIVFHHDDLDGVASAAVVVHSPLYFDKKEKVAIPVDYDKPFPIEMVDKNTIVFIVDYTPPHHIMSKLLKMYTSGEIKEWYWVDHHKTVIQKYNKMPWIQIPGIRSTGKAACELTWELFPHSPSETIPDAIRMIGEYDTWRFGKNTDVVDFKYGLEVIDDIYNPLSAYWISLINGDALINDIIYIGSRVRRRERMINERIAERNAFWIDFHGLNVVALNFVGNSFALESITEPHDAKMLFHFNGEKWIVGLYAGNTERDIDLSEIAKKYGGGGHPGASGFVTNQSVIDEILSKRRKNN